MNGTGNSGALEGGCGTANMFRTLRGGAEGGETKIPNRSAAGPALPEVSHKAAAKWKLTGQCRFGNEKRTQKAR